MKQQININKNENGIYEQSYNDMRKLQDNDTTYMCLRMIKLQAFTCMLIDVNCPPLQSKKQQHYKIGKKEIL